MAVGFAFQTLFLQRADRASFHHVSEDPAFQAHWRRPNLWSAGALGFIMVRFETINAIQTSLTIASDTALAGDMSRSITEETNVFHSAVVGQVPVGIAVGTFHVVVAKTFVPIVPTSSTV